MKTFAWSLLLIHLAILILWVINSGYLFSVLGVVIWLVAVVAGFIVQKRMKEHLLMKQLLLLSSFFMAFLSLITVGIYLVTSAMP
ncbi:MULTISPECIES: hypothetical protein [Bacillaceae]|uniref:hypothetical protein n=1 Tax=Bacillales TaxID=1385 RepID=UPI0018841198|nr:MULTISPECIES: hypothetical protein [Bacillaceae]MBF0707764.1 hypothetical protein [Pseudalkalibacillus hwajinpoensis]MDO6654462.1 hypothetical protein [Anaerobacillus sp. 1_MG-2023]